MNFDSKILNKAKIKLKNEIITQQKQRIKNAIYH